MIIQHNMPAIRALDDNGKNIAGAKKSSEKLSSGYRINRSADDAAGFAVSEKMRSRIKGLNHAVRNCQDGASLIQTFEGALSSTTSILQRMRELAIESANGSYDNSTDRAAIQLEYLQLCDEVDQISETDFNGLVMLCGENKTATDTADYANTTASSEFGISSRAAVVSAERAAFSARAVTTFGNLTISGGEQKELISSLWAIRSEY